MHQSCAPAFYGGRPPIKLHVVGPVVGKGALSLIGGRPFTLIRLSTGQLSIALRVCHSGEPVSGRRLKNLFCPNEIVRPDESVLGGESGKVRRSAFAEGWQTCRSQSRCAFSKPPYPVAAEV